MVEFLGLERADQGPDPAHGAADVDYGRGYVRPDALHD